MENTNSAQYQEIEAILKKTDPAEFNINSFINEVNKVKDKHKKPVNWSYDEWDNWYEH